MNCARPSLAEHEPVKSQKPTKESRLSANVEQLKSAKITLEQTLEGLRSRGLLGGVDVLQSSIEFLGAEIERHSPGAMLALGEVGEGGPAQFPQPQRHPNCGHPYCVCVGECFAASQPSQWQFCSSEFAAHASGVVGIDALPDVEFERWFKSMESGDGETELPTPQEANRWAEYIDRQAVALGAWRHAQSLVQPCFDHMVLPDVQAPETNGDTHE